MEPRQFSFVTLFPEAIEPFLRHSILGRAEESNRVRFKCSNPRDYAYDRHAKVDDTPFGGQPGMLLKPEPVALALAGLGVEIREHVDEDGGSWAVSAKGKGIAVILTDPAAPTFDQAAAKQLSEFQHLIFLCGHYEGIDHRVRTSLATHAFSIGDYILTNGEMPALVMADAIVRLLPGVLGCAASLDADSYSEGLLSAPNYTRPEVWRGMAVPEVLRSGDHRAILRWQRGQALEATRRYRPDLLARARLEKADLDMLSS